MTRKPESATITVSRCGAEFVREIAAAEGGTPRQYLEALLHYGASCHQRPGSWEANQPFNLQMYLSEECYADKWF